MQSFIEKVFAAEDYEQLYKTVREEEAQSKGILIEFQKDYPGVTKTENVNDILSAMKQKRNLNK